MNRRNRFVTLMIATALVSGCSVFKKDKKVTPVVGERIPVLVSDSAIAVDEGTAALPMALPPAIANDSWTQPGGNGAKNLSHLALGNALGLAWSQSVGDAGKFAKRLASTPVIADGRVYTIDTTATVRAFDAQSGAPVWAQRFGVEDRNEASMFGGGVAYDNGRIYATNGLGYVVALDAATGSPAWSVRPGGPLRGAPTVAGGAVYVMSQDNQIYSLKAEDGTTNWSNAASLEIAGVFGTAAPSVAQGTVVAGFSSGELNAYRYENGRQVWQDALARTSVSTSVSALNDIDADPVIDGGVVYAVGQGGRAVAIDLLSGQRIWELNIGGISTPWVAGEWLFLVTDEAKLVAIARATGKVRWIHQLPRWEKEKKKQDPITYVGPVLAGDRLIVAGSNGVLVNIDPMNGGFQSQTNVGASVSLQPVVAGSTLYILDDEGRLHAFR